MTRLNQNSLLLPEDLIFEIFSRLPSKSIGKCRCLSKFWASTLRHQNFTELFLTKSRAHPQLLFACQVNNEIAFFSSPQPENPEENSYVVVASHLARFASPYVVFGCTSGFFLYLGKSNWFGDEWKHYAPLLCNPSTGQSLALPKLEWKKRYVLESYHGYLGYEPIAKEFKVLSMITSLVCGEWISVQHQLLTLGTERLSWRSVECCVPHRPSSNWICISGVLYYIATAGKHMLESIIVCFDLSSEKFSFVNLMKTFCIEMLDLTTMVNYNGKLGLLMPREAAYICEESKSIELWVLQDAEWSNRVFVLPPSWEDVVSEYMHISGMASSSNEIVLVPTFQSVPSYVIYFNIERKTITKVEIQGLEAFDGKNCYTYLNYVENVKLFKHFK